MQSNYISYDFEKSRNRLDEILDASNNQFEEVGYIPARNLLTYTNGYYLNCTALFVDIRGSSKLTESHTRPVLAKIYRSYISEITALMNGSEKCKEINIHGDCVWGIFETPNKVDIDEVFGIASKIASLIDIMNYKLKKKAYETINIGIGVDYGRALMIKSGYNGSGINDIIWMGDVVNSAAKLCSYGNRSILDKEIMISTVIYNNLNNHNKLLLSWNATRNCYNGNVVNTVMNKWLSEQS